MTQGWVDRVIFTAVSVGVGNFQVGAAVQGYNTPALSSAVDGTSYHYSAQTIDHKGNITDWEVGTGVYTASTTTLTRVVELSSNGNAKVNFGSPPQVMITALAADFGAGIGAAVSQIIAGTNVTISPPGGTGNVTINSTGGGGGLTWLDSTNITYFVSTTGSDSNDGLTALTPFATIQHAVNQATEHYGTLYQDAASFTQGTIAIQLAAGTYTESVNACGTLGTGLGLTINGSETITTIAGTPCAVSDGTVVWQPGGGGYCLSAITGFITVRAIDFNAPSGGTCLAVNTTGTLAGLYVSVCSFGANTTGTAIVVGTESGSGGGLVMDGGCLIKGMQVNGPFVSASFGALVSINHFLMHCSVDPGWTSLFQVSDGATIAINGNDSAFDGTCIKPSVVALNGGTLTCEGTTTIQGTYGGIGTVDSSSKVVQDGVILSQHFTGDTGAGGTIGYVPKPAAGDAAAGKFLKADATWATPAGGGGGTGANPTATASDVAVNGVATTFLRSDAAPAVQKTSAAQFGLCKVDGSTITSVGGVITSVGGAAALAVNASAVTGGAGTGQVLYEDGTLREASHLTISSGNPNVSLNNAYLYNGIPAIQSPSTTNSNWFFGNAGNLTNTAINATGIGQLALAALTTGTQNTAAGAFASENVAAGNANTAFGVAALFTNVSGDDNTSIGFLSGSLLISSQNTSHGSLSLQSCSTGASNVAIGYNAINAGTSGVSNNTAIGWSALKNSNAVNNTAVGYSALIALTTGVNNTAVGLNAGSSIVGGTNNCFVGGSAGGGLTNESGVTCIGYQCGQAAVGLQSGDSLFGFQAGQFVTSSGGNNLGIGTAALATMAGGGGNVGLGNSALASTLSANNNMGIGGASLTLCTSGANNVGVGQNTLTSVTSQNGNVAIGQNAGKLLTAGDCILIGTSAGQDITTGAKNCIVGGLAGVTSGITTGTQNTVLGIGVTALTNPSTCVIIATGDGTIREDFGYTNASKWTFTGANIVVPSQSTAGFIMNDSSGNHNSVNTVATATSASAFSANRRLQITVAGTTYFLPVSTVAW